jgi:dienelactone hydrolase
VSSVRRLGFVLSFLVLACSRRSPAPPLAPSTEPRAEPVAVSSGVTQVPGFVRELRRIDVSLGDGETARLDALVTRPADGAPAPLVVLNHGSPRDPGERAAMSPANQAAQSLAFARRGYAAVAVMRRGFGETGGAFAEAPGPCSARDYVRASKTAARDVLGAVDALRKEPWVDPTRIVLVGHSAGGMTVLAIAAEGPPGLVAVVSFAGGRGSDTPDHVCQPDRLVDSVRGFGAAAKVPSLWIYAENDHFFAPPFVREMFDAYRAGGAPAELRFVPPFGDDGHRFFGVAPADAWWPLVAPFLAKLHLPVDLVRPREPAALAVAPPVPLSPAAREGFAAYLASDGYEKAFAAGAQAWAWVASQRTREEAMRKALERCAQHGATDCAIVAAGDEATH